MAPIIAYEVSLDTVDKPELPRVVPKKKPARAPEGDPEEEAPAADIPDPVRHEALNILEDLSSMAHSIRTAGSAPQASIR